MSMRRFPLRSPIATLLAVSLAGPMTPLASPGQAPAKAQAPAPTPAPTAAPATAKAAPAKAAPAKAAPAAPAPVPPDGGWPRAYTTASGASMMIYQPQVASWAEQKHVVLYAAVAYGAKGSSQVAIGTLKLESETSVALDHRLVSFSQFKIAEAKFSTLSRDQIQKVVDEIVASVPLNERVIALDRVLANIDTSQIIPKNVDGLKADPPPIFFSKTPAVLVNIDGDPTWSPIDNNDLQSAVNTNWDLFQHVPTKIFYLRNDEAWFKAAALQGAWEPAGTLPESFKKLPDDANWKEVKDSLPGKKTSASQMPKVFVATTPAEMILLKGEPTYVAVTGAPQLLWVSNTESDVFRMGRTGPVYFLVAGRWFSAPDFTGPWTFATPSMPAEFQKIPLEHERSRVLASVPGTAQAAEAVLLATIPQNARVTRTLQAPEVIYQGGTAQFQPIESTTIQRAVNTDKDILKVGDLYYMCFQGVWFTSTTETGPWKVTSDVPKVVYEIPPSSPSYNVTYVTVEDSNDDAVVFATTMAFTGMMIGWGCAVWGTGYYYPPYIYRGGYYGYYPTYGYGASYNPWTGAYTRRATAYGPYGGAGVASRYNPRTGTYSRGAAAWGPGGARGAASAYNPRTGAYGSTRQGSNVYGSWGQTGVARGDDWAATSRYTNNRTGTTTRATAGSGGGEAITRSGPGGTGGVARTGSGDVYAGRDGNVYRNQGGSWQQYENGNWNNVGTSRPTPGPTTSTGTRSGRTPVERGMGQPGPSIDVLSGLNRDSGARYEGNQRTRDSGSINSGGSSRTGSYRAGASRPAGGGARRR
jgi:hypothetical protein